MFQIQSLYTHCKRVQSLRSGSPSGSVIVLVWNYKFMAALVIVGLMKHRVIWSTLI